MGSRRAKLALRGRGVYQCARLSGLGWSVVPEFQGRGIATRAVSLLLEEIAADDQDRAILAYPAVENEASNAVCRKAGMTLIGETVVEFPPGRPFQANEWAIQPASARS